MGDQEKLGKKMQELSAGELESVNGGTEAWIPIKPGGGTDVLNTIVSEVDQGVKESGLSDLAAGLLDRAALETDKLRGGLTKIITK